MDIIKRTGEHAVFDKEKIINAITKAHQEAHMTEEKPYYAAAIANEIEQLISQNHEEELFTVEDIQELVEDFLTRYDKLVAKVYIRYRYKHGVMRACSNEFIRAISEKLMAKDVQNSNANVDEFSFGGRVGEASNEMTKQYALDFCMSEMARNNHLNNEIYIHDLSAYAVGMHNCASRDTKFLTDKGVYSFEDFNNNDEVYVITHTGDLKKAIVHSYGKQKLNKITFIRAGQTLVKERFTPNHRWLLADGRVTESLQIGDKILKAPNLRNFNFNTASELEKYYWCLGFVLGDGTEAYRWSHGKKNENIKFVRLRLCGDKTIYEPRFSILKHSTKEMENGDLYLTFSSVINFSKTFPQLEEMTWKEKAALFDGLYCADGQQSGNRKAIMTTNEQIASFIEDIAPSLGYYIIKTEDKTGEKTNYATRQFTKQFIFTGDENKYYWTVANIEEDKEEEVWCLDVEDDHSFVLPNGIVTGNCLSIPFDKLLAEGFNTRQTDVRPANSINTAFQLVAVIFQLQSLQQFGGCSATHLDWTMVPYVRKSFYKHYCDGVKYISQKDYFWIPGSIGDEKITENRWKDMANFICKWFKIDDVYGYSDEKAYKYAMDMTERELQQAVEGFYHNLNTLQSRSGN